MGFNSGFKGLIKPYISGQIFEKKNIYIHKCQILRKSTQWEPVSFHAHGRTDRHTSAKPIVALRDFLNATDKRVSNKLDVDTELPTERQT